MKKKHSYRLVNVFNNLKMRLDTTNAEFFLLVGILLLSFFLRFINYHHRWGIAYDQARDAIVTHFAYTTHQLPLIGPFSASGPFVFGPYWYWIHTFFTALNPHTVNWLWITQTFISALMPLLFFFIGKKTVNTKFGLLIAFLCSISTAQIAQSTNLTYSSFVGFISIVLLYFVIEALQSKKSKYIFVVGLLIGLSMNVHFQAVGMIFLLPLVLIFTGLKFKNIFISTLGFFIPFLPLLYFDFITDHFQSKSIIEFLNSRGEGNALQKRWLTYVLDFWPTSLGHIIGGNKLFGFFLMIFSSVILLYGLFKKRIPKEILVLVLFTGINILVLRYYKGNVYDAFLVYLHPSILMIVSYSVFILISKFKYLGIGILLILSGFTLFRNYHEIAPAYNMTAITSERFMNQAINRYPDKKFEFYDHNLKHTQRSFPTVLYFTKNNLILDNGYKLGITFATNSAELNSYNMPIISGDEGGPILLDLNSKSRSELEAEGWAFINPSIIYKSVVNWYK